MIFALKGNTKKQIHGAHARGPLEIKGCFHAQGPQPVDNDGGAPQWVADLMDQYPDVNQVAISSDGHSTVWSRISSNAL
jgi:hypothetical protein